MNYPKLKAKIAEKSISRKELCSLWKCSPTAASNKVNGKLPIRLDEAQAFSEYAELSDYEKSEIFLT